MLAILFYQRRGSSCGRQRPATDGVTTVADRERPSVRLTVRRSRRQNQYSVVICVTRYDRRQCVWLGHSPLSIAFCNQALLVSLFENLNLEIRSIKLF